MVMDFADEMGVWIVSSITPIFEELWSGKMRASEYFACVVRTDGYVSSYYVCGGAGWCEGGVG